MAKNKDQNEDPEEEKKGNQFEEDDDFGLPDLDYDELEEEADQELEETAESEVISEENAAAHEESGEESLGEDWEKELEDELEEDLKSGKFEEEVEAFYEEETFDEFESDAVESESVGSSVFGIDDDEIETSDKPKEEDSFFATEEPVVAAKSSPEPQYSQYLEENQDDNKGKFVRTVVLGTILFLVVGFAIYFLWDNTSGKSPEKEVAKVEAKKPEAPTETPKAVEKPAEKPVEAKKPSKPKANAVAAGQITTLSERTGKSYMVIGSFFDGDMAQDYADKLSKEGKSPFIIPPFKDYRFYRVAIAEYNSFNDATASVEGFKAEYGSEVWPLRY